MKNRALIQGVALASVTLFIGTMSLDADARGRSGGGARMAGAGGGFSHGGTARGGSFAARSAQPGAVAGGGGSMGVSDRAGTRQDFRADRAEGRQDLRGERQDDFTDLQEDRQDYRDEVRDDRQDFREEARDDWQDDYDDRDDHWDNWATGAAVQVSSCCPARSTRGTVHTKRVWSSPPSAIPDGASAKRQVEAELVSMTLALLVSVVQIATGRTNRAADQGAFAGITTEGSNQCPGGGAHPGAGGGASSSIGHAGAAGEYHRCNDYGGPGDSTSRCTHHFDLDRGSF